MYLYSIRKTQETSRILSILSFSLNLFPVSPSYFQPQASYHSFATQQIPQHHASTSKLHDQVDLFLSSPSNHYYYASLLESCISAKALRPGKQLHARLCQLGIAYNQDLATKLVNIYSVCNSLRNAHQLFDKIPKGNLFLWNVLIRAYAWNGPHEAAISLYHQMLEFGLKPDNFTLPFVLKACSALSTIGEGRVIHERVIRTGWERDVFRTLDTITIISLLQSIYRNTLDTFTEMVSKIA
ncbi:Pentatricopeptide repeat-containing protein [Spatholobus suberectus]|nr:Pentatricopeptide repeat-containing protein [Spatholobus suberectus]